MQHIAPLPSDASLAQQRGADRRMLRLRATVSSPRRGQVPVEVLNLSTAGMLLFADKAIFEEGDTLTAKLSPEAAATATVVWSNDCFHGLSFVHPLSKATVAAALLKAAAPSRQTAAAAHAAPVPVPVGNLRRTPSRTTLEPERNFLVPVALSIAFWTLLGAVFLL